ncbi:hypothetical protein [Jatrophihabitans endophyticus]|uniref:hypothetical protein n=1 Tax=Jatrophihabitans endophyticus TaxID=1206085 RepID=UPI001A10061C|nr:hypothetical protein [Jatrophihabitans endophyticus]MBE7188980.1 CopG family transcriptional regulator [Jatrophihabitans endophyticus]
MAMTLSLTDEQDHALTALAEAQKISKQEAAVRAIEDAASRRAETRDAVLRRIVSEDSELLDLLAK